MEASNPEKTKTNNMTYKYLETIFLLQKISLKISPLTYILRPFLSSKRFVFRLSSRLHPLPPSKPPGPETAGAAGSAGHVTVAATWGGWQHPGCAGHPAAWRSAGAKTSRGVLFGACVRTGWKKLEGRFSITFFWLWFGSARFGEKVDPIIAKTLILKWT